MASNPAAPSSRGPQPSPFLHLGWVGPLVLVALLLLLALLWHGCPPPDVPPSPDHPVVDGTGDTSPATADRPNPDPGRPDAAKPDAAKPDAAKPDAAMPDAIKPDAAMPAQDRPDGGSRTPVPPRKPPLATPARADMAHVDTPSDAGTPSDVGKQDAGPSPPGIRYPNAAQHRAWRAECGTRLDYARCRDYCKQNAITRRTCDDLYGPNRFD